MYDFQVDVLRIAVSVCSHAFTNGLPKHEVDHVLRAFTDTYVETLVNYVGGDKELLYELTPETASGQLKSYLTTLKDDKSTAGQLEKFTEVDDDGERRFIHSKKTRLVPVDDDTLQMIRDQFVTNKGNALAIDRGFDGHAFHRKARTGARINVSQAGRQQPHPPTRLRILPIDMQERVMPEIGRIRQRAAGPQCPARPPFRPGRRPPQHHPQMRRPRSPTCQPPCSQ